MKLKLTITLILIFLISISSSKMNAQNKELQKLVDNPDKLWGGIQYTYGIGQVKKWQIKKGFCTEDDYKIPKKSGTNYILY